MENKVLFKKFIIVFFTSSIIFIGLFSYLNFKEYNNYKVISNQKIASIVELIKSKYPNIKDSEIMEILKSENSEKEVLKSFGYEIYTDNYINQLKNNSLIFLSIETTTFILSILILLLFFLKYDFNRNREIKKITALIEKINHKNYELEIEEYTEDELSILKSEIFKTTLMLKEIAENSKEEKLILKDTLSDISHQLKTPLTSILIMIDNILDDKEMSPDIRASFLKNIKREILKINFLVQSILKLSRFESNTISFNIEEVKLSTLLEEALKNISSLCDLKNIEIEINNSVTSKIKCDINWQIEAFTNILKNAIEHSKENSKIIIEITENSIYKQIIIKDFGTGIDSVDLKHIFERFYKSKNSNKDSIGIGLELSKKIIESANGRIDVSSKVNRGTIFTIKYFNY